MYTNTVRSAIVILTTLVLSTGIIFASEQNPLEPPVATVNGAPITGAEFNRQFLLFQERMARAGRMLPPDKIGYIQSIFLDNLINSELLFQESKKQNIIVETAEIDEQFNTLKAQYQGEADFRAALSGMNLTEQELRQQILESVAVQKLVQEKVEKDIRVSPEESKKYYEDHRDTFAEPEQVRASHILAKADSGADEKKKTEARMKIEKIRDRIKNGEDFATLAKELSEGPSSVNGGDLGFFARGQMVPPFEEAAFALQPDQLSDIVETRFGYHLIRVTDRKAEQKFTYEQVQDEVNNQVVQLKMKEAMSRYIKSLRDTAKIENFLK